MKQIVWILLTIIVIVGCETKDVVFICKGDSAECYHKTRKCKGLKKCRGGIMKVELLEATTTYGKRECRICYKLNKLRK